MEETVFGSLPSDQALEFYALGKAKTLDQLKAFYLNHVSAQEIHVLLFSLHHPPSKPPFFKILKQRLN